MSDACQKERLQALREVRLGEYVDSLRALRYEREQRVEVRAVTGHRGFELEIARICAAVFAPVIPAPADFDNELRWIAGELGKARDWEVLAGSTLKKAFDSAADDADGTAVQQAAQNIATENRKAAVAAVNSVRYTRLIIQFTLWIDQKGWRKSQSKQALKALAQETAQARPRPRRTR
jgi:CHAD domain-containing protein